MKQRHRKKQNSLEWYRLLTDKIFTSYDPSVPTNSISRLPRICPAQHHRLSFLDGDTRVSGAYFVHVKWVLVYLFARPRPFRFSRIDNIAVRNCFIRRIFRLSITLDIRSCCCFFSGRCLMVGNWGQITAVDKQREMLINSTSPYSFYLL